MKRTMLFIVLLLGLGLCAFAQEEPAQDDATFFQKIGRFFLDLDAKADQVDQGERRFASGLGLEWDMNSRHNFAGGLPLSFDYNLPVDAAPFAIGMTITTSANFSNAIVLEPAGMFRWYFLGGGHTGFFAQADIGAYLIFEDGIFYPLFLGGLRGGYRLPFGSMFYVDPYVRVGYPFVFGIGASAGIRF